MWTFKLAPHISCNKCWGSMGQCQGLKGQGQWQCWAVRHALRKAERPSRPLVVIQRDTSLADTQTDPTSGDKPFLPSCQRSFTASTRSGKLEWKERSVRLKRCSFTFHTQTHIHTLKAQQKMAAISVLD